MMHNLTGFNYDKNLIEWCVLDDGKDKLFTEKNIKKYIDIIKPIKLNYVYQNNKKNIGQKRNQLVKLSNNKIVIFMDDDDIYMNNYLKHSVDRLKKTKCGLVGSNQMLFTFPNHNYRLSMIQCGAKRQIHEATMCFTKKYYNSMGGFEESSKGEGAKMIDFNENNVDLTDIRQVMVCVSHSNTISKEMFYTKRNKLKKMYFKEIEILQDILEIKYDPDYDSDNNDDNDKNDNTKNDTNDNTKNDTNDNNDDNDTNDNNNDNDTNDNNDDNDTNDNNDDNDTNDNTEI